MLVYARHPLKAPLTATPTTAIGSMFRRHAMSSSRAARLVSSSTGCSGTHRTRVTGPRLSSDAACASPDCHKVQRARGQCAGTHRRQAASPLPSILQRLLQGLRAQSESDDAAVGVIWTARNLWSAPIEWSRHGMQERQSGEPMQSLLATSGGHPSAGSRCASSVGSVPPSAAAPPHHHHVGCHNASVLLFSTPRLACPCPRACIARIFNGLHAGRIVRTTIAVRGLLTEDSLQVFRCPDVPLYVASGH